MKTSELEDLETNVLVAGFILATTEKKKRKIIRKLGASLTAHLHFLSQLYALGEPFDRVLYRKIVGELFPRELPRLKESLLDLS
jgi:hypothetical protein